MRNSLMGVALVGLLLIPMTSVGPSKAASKAGRDQDETRTSTLDKGAGRAEKTAGPVVGSLSRGVLGNGGVIASSVLHQVNGTLGQTFVFSPLTNGPDPITNRVCSGWWCVDYGNLVSVDDPGPPTQVEFGLPSPNPSTGSMQMSFALPNEARVDAYLIDVSGRRVRTLANGHFNVGRHSLSWDGRDEAGNAVHAGMYFMRMVVDGREAGRRRVVVVR